VSSSLIYEFFEGIAQFTVYTVKNVSDIPAGDEKVAKHFFQEHLVKNPLSDR
jgi:hypothetical protein